MEHTTGLALYSQTARLDHSRQALGIGGYGSVTLCGKPFQVTSPRSPSGERDGFATMQSGGKSGQLQRGLLQFRSPLLLESLLISFPPANDMLKFTGCSCSSALGVVSRLRPRDRVR